MAFVVFVTLAAVIVRLVRGSRPERQLDWFCFQYDLELSDAGRERVLSYLGRTRMWRVVGAVGGIAASMVPLYLWQSKLVDVYTGLFGGWFVVGVLAELTSHGPTGDGRRTASLAPRTLDQFLPPSARVVLVGSGLVAAAALGIAAVRRSIDRFRHPVNNPPDGWTITLAAVVMASVLMVAALAVRRLLRKPYPVDDPDLDAAEYAIRTAAIVRIVAGCAVLLDVIAFRVAAATAVATRGSWAWVPGSIAIVAFAGIVIAWAGVPTRVVRRSRHRLGTA